jgi:hypothetical protein
MIMNLYRISPKKNKAQAMVEFALVLPILLLLLYGLLEAGRLLFIYSTIVTASRQAVRYGSATGQGIVSTTVPRYQDCAGIRDAANKVDFLNAFDHTSTDVVIQWDTGPGTTANNICAAGAAFDTTFAPTTNSTRLLVNIDGDYLPIVPKIVGFLERSVGKNNPIEAQSARTVLVSVAIVVTVPPSTWQASTPTSTPTPPVTATFTPSNTPTSTLTSTPIVTSTPSVTPTHTLSPTVTNTSTPSLTPTITPTTVTGCGTIATGAGTLTVTGSTMYLTIPNPNLYPVNVQDIFVKWNHDKGHQQGLDKNLVLLSAGLLGNPTPFWTGTSAGPSNTLTSTPPVVLPANTTVTIVFTFNQSYERTDGTEEILINFSTPGCQGVPVHEPS